MSPRHVALGLVAILATAACEPRRDDGPHHEATPTLTPPPASDNDVRLFTRSRALMGTVFELTIAGAHDDVAEAGIRAAFDEIARLEGLLLESTPTSDIARINANAGKTPTPVSADTIRVIRAGIHVSEWSGGAFDLSWAALRGLYRYTPGDERVPTARELRAKLPLVRWQDIVVNDQASTVFLRREGMAIGTGGLVKGYALDRAGEILIARGLRHFMLTGGDQVLLRGKRGARPWRVGLRHPRGTAPFAYVEAQHGSFATSGDYEQFFERDGRRYHRILDTDTGLPVEHTVSVTVRAHEAVTADALATACFVLGRERTLQMLASLPLEADALIVDRDLRVTTTPRETMNVVYPTPLVDGVLPPP